MHEGVVHPSPPGRRATLPETALGARPVRASPLLSSGPGLSTDTTVPASPPALTSGPALLRLVRQMGRKAARADLAATAADRPALPSNLKDLP